MTRSIEPVLIVGAGPVGCVAALHLARRGVPVVLLEAEAELALDLRASTFHPPTLDMLDELGLTSRLLPQGLIAPTFQYRRRSTGTAASFDVGTIADLTRHPYRLQCEQYKLTQEAIELLARFPHVRTVFGARVEQVTQDADGVILHVEDNVDGFRQYRGSFAIGADGGNSRMRRSQAISFRGFTYPERFLVLSTPFEFADVHAGLCHVNYVWDPREWCVLLRTTTLWRVLFPTPPQLSDAAVLSEPFVQGRLAELAPGRGPFEVAHRSLYRVHQRVAERWRSGRVILAGDACHLNNPLGGMGMNGGIHDAICLAEQLESMLLEGGSTDLLDLYERRRRGVCVNLVQEQTIRNKRLIEEPDPAKQLEHHAELLRSAADPVAAREFVIRNCMISSLREAAAVQ